MPEGERFTGWTFGDLEEMMELERGGQTLVGRATALISVERKSSMNSRITRMAMPPPNTMSCSTW